MKVEFFKYQGTGNDFIMINNLDGKFPKQQHIVRKMCSRKYGIGSDGLICVDRVDDCDFYMDFFNPDGSQSFCGNGSRCVVAFAKYLGLLYSKAYFKAVDGYHEAEINDEGEVKVKMIDVDTIEIGKNFYIMNTGSPHYITEVDNLQELDMFKLGREIRFSERFKDAGINVNAVKLGDDYVSMRTYERGVENETLSCGTGVTAVALSSIHKGWFDNKVKIKAPGGNLSVEAKYQGGEKFTDVWLIGEAEQVFKGEFDV